MDNYSHRTKNYTLQRYFKFTLLFWTGFILTTHGQALEWAKGIGGASNDVAYSSTVDGSGNVYTVGYFHSSVDFDPGAGDATLVSNGGGMDIFITKFDATGNFVWAKKIGGPSSEVAEAVITDAQGYLYITGSFRSTVDFDPGAGVHNVSALGTNSFVCKLSSDGDFQWVKAATGYDPISSLAVATDASGNVYNIGTFESNCSFDTGSGTVTLYATGLSDIYIAKYTASGTFVWAKKINGNSSLDDGFGITTDALGNVYTCGSFQSSSDFDLGTGVQTLTSNGNRDIFVTKYDANGSFIWAKCIGGSDDDVARAITVDASQNVYICGNFQDTVDFDAGTGVNRIGSNGGEDIFISKLDANGNFVWTNTMGSIDSYTNVEVALSVQTDASGAVFAAGYFYGTVDFDPGAGSEVLTAPSYKRAAFLAKYSSNGTYEWARKFEAQGECFGRSVAVHGGNIYVTAYYINTCNVNINGGTYNLPVYGLEDFFILKINDPTTSIISGQNPTATFVISPNPGTTAIQVQTDEQIKEIKIVNILGELVQTESNTSFSVSELPSGMYIIQVNTPKGILADYFVKE